MVRELSELLADSVDARARSVAGLTPDADDFATMVRTVRRRRVVRRSLQTLAVVPLVGGLAAGAYFGLGSLRAPDVDPAVTPTDSVVSPTPSPTTAELERGELVTEPGLPPYYEAPADLLSHTGDGWVAMTYRPQSAALAAGETEPLSHVLVLAAPDGAMYRTAELPLDLDVQLLYWQAGAAQARVWWTDGESPLTVGVLDVLTGDLVADDVQFERWASFIGYSAVGAELWVEDPVASGDGPDGEVTVWSIAPDGSRRTVASLDSMGVPMIDPAGRQLLTEGVRSEDGFAVVDLDSGAVREVSFGMPDQTCVVVGWLDAVAVATLCHDPVSDEAVAAMDRVDYVAQHAGLYRVETVADGGTTPLRTFAAGDPVPEAWTGLTAAAGTLAYVVSNGFPGGCSLGVALWDGTTPRLALDGGEHSANVFMLRPGGAGTVLVTGSESCESGGVQWEITSIDTATGATSLLTPWLEADPGAGIDYWYRTVTSAAAAAG